jgi:hypothetical protein
MESSSSSSSPSSSLDTTISTPSVLDAKIVISKGFSLSLYIVAIVIFTLVFFIGLYLSYKNFSNIVKRNNDDVIMKNIGNTINDVFTNFVNQTKITSIPDAVNTMNNFLGNGMIKMYPSKTPLIVFLVDATNKVLFDSSSNSPTTSSYFTSLFSNPNATTALQKASASKDGLVTLADVESKSLKCNVFWNDSLKIYLVLARVLN